MAQTRDPVTGQIFEDGKATNVDPGIIGGERNTDDSTNNLTVTKEECNATILDGTSAVAVSGGAPAYLMQILIITSGTTATITGLLDNLDAAKDIVITSSAASQIFDFKAARCETALTVNPSVDDDVVVFWRPIG